MEFLKTLFDNDPDAGCLPTRVVLRREDLLSMGYDFLAPHEVREIINQVEGRWWPPRAVILPEDHEPQAIIHVVSGRGRWKPGELRFPILPGGNSPEVCITKVEAVNPMESNGGSNTTYIDPLIKNEFGGNEKRAGEFLLRQASVAEAVLELIKRMVELPSSRFDIGRGCAIEELGKTEVGSRNWQTGGRGSITVPLSLGLYFINTDGQRRGVLTDAEGSYQEIMVRQRVWGSLLKTGWRPGAASAPLEVRLAAKELFDRGWFSASHIALGTMALLQEIRRNPGKFSRY
ncbi:MAG: hypothetical protein GXP43_03185 [bacterium]|nr:hypothetical protein [bacterium]